uniref:DUF659 domain-containing protein n=1 Tax=Brassica oleracea var. oleracea TaxID=109376 RepID=A0A0D3CDT3_BRAOL
MVRKMWKLSLNRKLALNKRKKRGLLNIYVTSTPPGIMKGRKDMMRVFGVCDKELREKVCAGIARWFYDACILFNDVIYDSFKEMTDLIGQYGMSLKISIMLELRVSLFQKEVANTPIMLFQRKNEWAAKRCSIMSNGGRDSVVQKDIVNFLVNSHKDFVFINSKEVSKVVKNATMLFKLLDEMVEDVGKLLEAKQPNLYWTPCASHYLDLILEDIDGEKKPAMGYIYATMDKGRKAIAMSFKMKQEKYENVFEIIDKRLVPDSEVQDKVMLELDLFKKATGLFGHNMEIRQREMKALADWWSTYRSPALNLRDFAVKLHTKRRNSLAQHCLNDKVFVKYNRALKLRMKRSDIMNHILVEEIDESNEWLMGKMKENSHNNYL